MNDLLYYIVISSVWNAKTLTSGPLTPGCPFSPLWPLAPLAPFLPGTPSRPSWPTGPCHMKTHEYLHHTIDNVAHVNLAAQPNLWTRRSRRSFGSIKTNVSLISGWTSGTFMSFSTLKSLWLNKQDLDRVFHTSTNLTGFPEFPVGPLAPSIPGAPLAPGCPWGPGVPGSPVWPWIPGMPGRPVGPGKP